MDNNGHLETVLVKPEHAKDRKFKALPESAWQALCAMYGGGPPIQKLVPCELCEVGIVWLNVNTTIERGCCIRSSKAIRDKSYQR